MIGKYFDLSRSGSLNEEWETMLNQSPWLLSSPPEKTGEKKGHYEKLTHSALYAYSQATRENFNLKTTVNHVENAIQRAVNQATIYYESKMVLLGSIVSGAPFLGLLGTVWGVMDAFGGIATENNAQIQTLAPGVSGALLTTVAALLVAIPSVFGYNFLLTRTKIMITELETFANFLANRIERETLSTKESTPSVET